MVGDEVAVGGDDQFKGQDYRPFGVDKAVVIACLGLRARAYPIARGLLRRSVAGSRANLHSDGRIETPLHAMQGQTEHF
jgi:hypothetical protein